MAIGIDTFDLSMTSPDTGRYLTANFYTVDGVTNADGSLRQLSIGQLVMAICLSRASKLEADIIALMEEMNTTSAELKIMTTIEEKVIGWTTADPQPHPGYEHLYHDTISGTGTNYDGKTYMDVLRSMGIIGDGIECVRWSGSPDPNDIMYDDFITALESKMDEKNTFSQQKMIELQSLTNKRDQSYDMISNVLKSLNTTIIGNINNM
ncbi:MAG: hypothetical protein J6Q49_01490 [Kiritimatiellae bacterium]|nr:hypothetical protein [Kiritimatiellia bacterium]MBQ3749360.1 hypothetical protein [Kiritimatiellia bacterium]